MKNRTLFFITAILISINSFGQKGDTLKVKKKTTDAPGIIKNKPKQLGWLQKVPAIIVKVGNCNSGKVTVDSLLLNPNLLIYAGFGTTPLEGWVLDSISVIIIVPNGSKKEEIFEYKFTGPALSEEIITKIKSLKPKSVIVLSKIRVSNSPTGQKNHLTDIAYIIKRPGE